MKIADDQKQYRGCLKVNINTRNDMIDQKLGTSLLDNITNGGTITNDHDQTENESQIEATQQSKEQNQANLRSEIYLNYMS